MTRNVARLVVVPLAVTAILGFTACNYTDGPCYRREDIETAGPNGAGGGPIVPGWGGYGDVPPKPQSTTEPEPVDCTLEEQPDKGNDQGSGTSCGDLGVTKGETYVSCGGPCEAKCLTVGAGTFSPSLFKFMTTIADDGQGKGGGWQEASTTLRFVRWTGVFPESWDCPIKVGMPLRTAVNGAILAEYAATVSAEIANAAGHQLMHGSTELPQGILCAKLPGTMTELFKARYPSIGARVTKP